jgi:hypothetical protein
LGGGAAAESEQRRRWLAAAGELTHRLLSSGTDEPLLLITQEAATAADADVATLAMPDGDDRLVVGSVYGVEGDQVLGRTESLFDSPRSWASSRT